MGQDAQPDRVRASIARGTLDSELKNLETYKVGDFNTFDAKPLNVGQKQALQRDLKSKVAELRLEADQKQAELQHEITKYKKGTWYFDPKKIDPEFERVQASNRAIGDIPEKGIKALLYSLPELGSSFSSFESFCAQFGIQYAGTKAATKLAGKHPGLALATELATQGASLYTSLAMREDETNIEAADAYKERVQQMATDG